MLLFQIADEPWAIAAAEVKDLVPLVTLQPYAGAAERVAAPIAGLLNYHGEHLPVVDVAQSVAHQRAPSVLSTRIAIVEMPIEAPVEAPAEASVTRLGLILDRAYETAYLTESVNLPVNSPYVSATLEGPDGIVQQLAIANLLNFQ